MCLVVTRALCGWEELVGVCVVASLVPACGARGCSGWNIKELSPALVLVVPGSEYGLLPSLLWGCGWGKGWVLLVGWVQTRCWVLKDRTPVWVGSFVGSRSGWWSGFSVAGAAGFGHTRSVSYDVHSGVCGGWGVWWLVCLVVAGCWLRTVQWTRASLWLVKFLRAHGGCLGTRNRRRT